VGLQKFLHAIKSLTWDLPALLPIREEGVLRIFITLKNPSPWPGFEPATFGSSGQHTKVTQGIVNCLLLSMAVKHETPFLFCKAIHIFILTGWLTNGWQ
jgi:hypothetical protein